MSAGQAFERLKTPVQRRGLSRTEAAVYIGVGAGTFEKLMKSGKMPLPKRIGQRAVWDVVALDLAFDRIADDRGQISPAIPVDSNEWDEVLRK